MKQINKHKQFQQYIKDLINGVDMEEQEKVRKLERIKQQKKNWYEKNKKLKGRKK